MEPATVATDSNALIAAIAAGVLTLLSVAIQTYRMRSKTDQTETNGIAAKVRGLEFEVQRLKLERRIVESERDRYKDRLAECQEKVQRLRR